MDACRRVAEEEGGRGSAGAAASVGRPDISEQPTAAEWAHGNP